MTECRARRNLPPITNVFAVAFASVPIALVTFLAPVPSLGAQQEVSAQTIYAFDLPEQPLAESLRAVGHQTSTNVMFEPRTVRNLTAPALRAQVTTTEALQRLLSGTALSLVQTAPESILIESAASAREAPGGVKPVMDSSRAGDQDGSKGGKSGSSAGFRVAQAGQGLSAQAADVTATQGSANAVALDEIVVTAQKRQERLLDVPIPVTAINTQSLVEHNQLRLQDYYTTVPGFAVTPSPSAGGEQLLTVRGITTGFGTPTVGVTIDDVPFGTDSIVPDLDPGDLDRIEVLRGPQGTLYGASSMGGLLKFVTQDPSIDAFSGRVEAGASDIHNGPQVGYNIRGSINAPLGDTAAVRASAFTRLDPGYIDNPVLGIKGINQTRVGGGRLAALWRPLGGLTVKLSALYQDTRGDGANDVDLPVNGYTGPVLGDLQQDYFKRIGAFDRKIQAYAATVTGHLGSVEVTSLTGYNINSWSDSLDYSYVFGGATGLLSHNTTDKLTQEVRLAMPIGEKFDWLLGGYFGRENGAITQSIATEVAATGEVSGVDLTIAQPKTNKEYAAFTDLTYHFSDRLSLQIGGRESRVKISSVTINTGPLVQAFYSQPSPYVIPGGAGTTQAFTYLASPQLKVSENLMVYARLASGYRPGGANSVPNAPATFKPDKTENYEVGSKGEFLDHTVSIDASLYYINWKDIQLTLQQGSGLGYEGNGSGAKSEGIELSLALRPLTGLAISLWGAWDEAVLTKALPISTAYGMPGDRLPFSSRLSGSVSLQQDFPIVGDVSGFVGGSLSYVGDRPGFFTASLATARQIYPAYAKTDLRVGAKYDTWTLNGYVNNVADKRGELGGGVGGFPPFAFNYIQPRTVGFSLAKVF